MEELNYEYIRTVESYNSALNEISSQKLISLDLEFDRDHFAYGFTLCLIQVYIPTKAFLFDPFVLKDLSALLAIFEDNKVIKVMHSPAEDIQLLQQYNCYPKNIFDTERTARMLNYSSFSLSSLLKSILDVEISKSMQKSDWTQTPLSDKQLHYAALDVWYLFDLRESLNRQIISDELKAWIKEENAFWDSYQAGNSAEGIFYTKEEGRKLPPYYLYIYNALLKVRDKYANNLNKPGYKVIDKNTLKDCVFQPELINQWIIQKGIHPSLKNNKVAQEMLEAFESAKAKALHEGLAKSNPFSKMTFDERQKQKELTASLKKESASIWEPLRAYIIEKYGEHTLSYIFNEKTLLALTSNEVTIDSIPYNYRIELLNRFKP